MAYRRAGEPDAIEQELERMRGDAAGQRQKTIAALNLRLSQIEDRLGRLTDAYIDRLIEEELFEGRKKTLLSDRLDLRSQIGSWENGKLDAGEAVANAGYFGSFYVRARDP
jgi:hypothetical protein